MVSFVRVAAVFLAAAQCAVVTFAFHSPSLRIQRAKSMPDSPHRHCSFAIDPQEFNEEYSMLCPALRIPKGSNTTKKVESPATVLEKSTPSAADLDQSVLEQFLDRAVADSLCGAAVGALGEWHRRAQAEAAAAAGAPAGGAAAAAAAPAVRPPPPAAYAAVVTACLRQGKWVSASRAFQMHLRESALPAAAAATRGGATGTAAGAAGAGLVSAELALLLATGLAELGQEDRAAKLVQACVPRWGEPGGGGGAGAGGGVGARAWGGLLRALAAGGRPDLLGRLLARGHLPPGAHPSAWTLGLLARAHGRAGRPRGVAAVLGAVRTTPPAGGGGGEGGGGGGGDAAVAAAGAAGAAGAAAGGDAAAAAGAAAGSVAADVVLLNSVVDAFVQCGDVRRARQVVAAMRRGEYGPACPPNARTYNTLIKGLARRGDRGAAQAAFGLVAEMEGRGLAPTEVTLHTLVAACARAGMLGDARQLLDRCHTHYLAGSTGEEEGEEEETRGGEGPAAGAAAAAADRGGGGGGGGGAPGVEAYTALLNGYARRGRQAEALAVLRLMLERGVAPNAVTLTALVSACVRGGDLDAARGLVAFLEARRGRDPQGAPLLSAATYNALLTGLCRGDAGEAGLGEAAALLKRMERLGTRADATTYNVLIQGLVAHPALARPRFEQAEALLGLMRRRGVAPDQVTLTILLKAYGRQGQMERARAVWADLLASKSSPPDTVALNSYLDACIKNGELKEAIATFEDILDQDKIQPDVITFSILITALSRNSNIFSGGKAIALYREMRSLHKIEPDTILVDSLLRACCTVGTQKKGDVLDRGFARELLSDLQILGWPEDQIEERRQVLRSVVPTLDIEVVKESSDTASKEGVSSSSFTAAKKELPFQEQDDTEEVTSVPSVVEQIFEKHGWNKIDSGFSAVDSFNFNSSKQKQASSRSTVNNSQASGSKKNKNTEKTSVPSVVEAIFEKRGWNKFDSGFNSL